MVGTEKVDKITTWNAWSSHITKATVTIVGLHLVPYQCSSMLVTEPNVVWLLVTVLVAIVFVNTTLASDCLLCQILPCPRYVWKIHGVGWHNSAGSSDVQVIWVARLSSNSKNRENPLFKNNQKSILLKHVCKIIDNKQMMFAFLANRRRKNIERGGVAMMGGYSDTNVSKVWDFEFL